MFILLEWITNSSILQITNHHSFKAYTEVLEWERAYTKEEGEESTKLLSKEGVSIIMYHFCEVVRETPFKFPRKKKKNKSCRVLKTKKLYSVGQYHATTHNPQ